MDRCGIFTKPIEDWDDKPAAEKTWNNFVVHFKSAYRRHKNKEKCEQAAGRRPMANSAMGGNTPAANAAMETLATSMDQHLANYAAVPTADREALANLTQTNATLVATNAELTTKMNQCLLELSKMQTEIQKLQQKVKGRNSRTRNGNGNGNGGGNGNGNSNTSGNAEWKYYCWSCGLTNDRMHTSMNCPNPKEGHLRHATFERKFGGSKVGCQPATT